MVADLQRFIGLYAVALEAENAAERKPEEVRPARVMNRRALLVAFAAVPAAVAAPATLGLALGGSEEERAGSQEPAARFTIDVSQHDWNRRSGNLDWEAVRRAGIAGMCARATYGDPSGYHHPSYHFGDFVRAAGAAGFLVRGGYHNLVRGDQASINRQVDWLRRELDAYGANWAMLDIERYAELVSADMWPRWDDVRRFDDRWAALEERVLVGYLPPWNWNKYLGQPDLRAFRGPLIASNYPLSDNADEYRRLYARCGGDNGRGWASYGNRISEGWQFSARAKVPGAASVCGINAWRMSFDQLKALLTRPA
jgi:Glycosyl hydrolases family 25